MQFNTTYRQTERSHLIDTGTRASVDERARETTYSMIYPPKTTKFGIGCGQKTSGGHKSNYKPFYDLFTPKTPSAQEIFLDAEVRLPTGKARMNKRNRIEELLIRKTQELPRINSPKKEKRSKAKKDYKAEFDNYLQSQA
jgi:hypothetical protein